MRNEKMAKMLMGQIDHARNRIRELRAEKIGKQPVFPKPKVYDDLIEDLRNDAVNLPNGQITLAFWNFIEGNTVDVVTTETRYSYHRNNNTETLPDVKTESTADFRAQLINFVYGAQRQADLNSYYEARAEWTALDARVGKEAKIVEDAIVLGDNAAALRALQIFAATKF
jgi:hypothetical protein